MCELNTNTAWNPHRSIPFTNCVDKVYHEYAEMHLGIVDFSVNDAHRSKSQMNLVIIAVLMISISMHVFKIACGRWNCYSLFIHAVNHKHKFQYICNVHVFSAVLTRDH